MYRRAHSCRQTASSRNVEFCPLRFPLKNRHTWSEARTVAWPKYSGGRLKNETKKSSKVDQFLVTRRTLHIESNLTHNVYLKLRSAIGLVISKPLNKPWLLSFSFFNCWFLTELVVSLFLLNFYQPTQCSCSYTLKPNHLYSRNRNRGSISSWRRLFNRNENLRLSLMRYFAIASLRERLKHEVNLYEKIRS